MKVLIVDDSRINLKVEQKIMEHVGLTVETAISGEECLEKVKSNKYDLIFMDIMMPEMDGIKTFINLQKIEGFDTPVITLTADAEVGAREKYLNLGFKEYIAKPLQIEKLKNTLEIITVEK